MFDLVLSQNGREISRRTYAAARVRIGRDAGAEVRIDHPSVSREHAVIEGHEGAHVLRDLGSQNGTLVRGRRVATHPLNDGDVAALGEFELAFFARRTGAPAEPAPVPDAASFAVAGATLQFRGRAEHEQLERTAGTLAYLEDAGEGRAFVVDRDIVLFGRGKGCDVRVGGLLAPRIAAALVRGHGGFSLVRLGRTPLARNLAPVGDRTWLSAGDEIAVGARRFVLREALPPGKKPELLPRPEKLHVER